MKSKTVDEAKKFLDITEKGEAKKAVSLVSEYDYMEESKRKVFSFLTQRFEDVLEDISLKKLVAQKLVEKLASDDEDLSVSNLLNIWKTVGEDTTEATRVLLGLIAPTKDSPNPYLEKVNRDEESMKTFDNASSKDLQNVHAIQAQLEIMNKRLAMQQQSENISKREG